MVAEVVFTVKTPQNLNIQFPVDHSFSSGNLLFTNPNGYDPNMIIEVDLSGNLVHNYSTWLENEPSKRCVARDLAFLDSSTLLMLDSQQGIFYASSKGNVKGIWSNLATGTKGVLGCDLQRFSVDLNNKKIYVISTNINCDYSYIPGVFVYDISGTFQTLLTHEQFEFTWDVVGDESGDIWVTNTQNIFVFRAGGEKNVDIIDPIKNKLGYNGIQLSPSGTILVTVPAPVNDLLIEIDPTSATLSNTYPLVGNTTSTGSLSGIPGSIVIDPNTNDIIIEVPWASKKEGKDVDVVQIYSKKGNLKSSFGGHSCKDTNLLCVPLFGMINLNNKQL
ncbi:hypothetical protein PPL_04154 [Heterostelium album PN500]|uniref:SMP-30/Gluconolactonase/LRE-like region domain-containing protein n=1 Tax=Heterostelium pallidum (strain ATCC 26659 / Pp 5 / PN500) TaxID=670386 RepID=D3B663_HETP5|nr:hypothetical protein PPL_04154 [Heterostelium album PN500]EFA83361.1 hypothetical protein PPL_04154 [Heterostelium album PN500]|eukprot:XP_020435478.1 hypothetical protein PPL_04154 [Heterostelium album PN500]